MRIERPCETKQADTHATSTYRNAVRGVAAVLARAAKKYYPQGGDFFKATCLPLLICFAKLRERLTNTL